MLTVHIIWRNGWRKIHQNAQIFMLQFKIFSGLCSVIFVNENENENGENENITTSLTKTKTKTKKWWKLKPENRKRLKTKMPKQQNLSLNESASIQYGTYGCYSRTALNLTNGGRYLGRPSTRLRQQVWYFLVVGKTKTKTKKYCKTKTKLKLKNNWQN